ncbi:homoserine kinase [Segniliparus rotundus DSM 44985]|uniref:Homoserine kinase n=1 Tax=Segniliparus rotundus (strain ATCC BAA-972 / CDC 1076 / CIP 108378 / DSM 44985 / JCM 13578) TaxID=640132 RepID=D6ZDA2_SEGRD|nr:homoserine kinase [Segniliparus rotundus]ADG97166.1 homoserine kinase [Segniliparus rotundus DSM 44985]
MTERAAGAPLPVGLSATARVPASSANLGSGFDSLAVALAIYDQVSATVAPDGLRGEVVGEDADVLAVDETHLVVRAVRRGLAMRGRSAAGLVLRCDNAVPHARGLGSSATAVVAGLAVAQALVAKADGNPELLDRAELVRLAGEFEGHADNAAASVFGGGVVSWVADDGHCRATQIQVSAQVKPVVFIPQSRGVTHVSRGILPDLVPRADAVANLSRSALMVVALTREPALLFDASQDWLHQPHRAAEQPETAELVRSLRARGFAAMVSGAGPSVLALAASETELRALAETPVGQGWERREIPLARPAQAW